MRCLNDAIEELYQLKRARKCFHAPEPYQTVAQAEAAIKQNLQKRKLDKLDCHLYFTEDVLCCGIWQKPVIYYRKYAPSETHPTYYLLYTADRLDCEMWEALKKKINRQILELEKDALQSFYSKPAYAICILCNEADGELKKQVTKIQSFQLTQAHVCIGVVPQNEWYLPAYRVPEKESSALARSLLGKATFGLKHATFPYRDNKEYTDEYYNKLDLYCSSAIRELITDNHRHASRHAIRDLFGSIGKSTTFERVDTDELLKK